MHVYIYMRGLLFVPLQKVKYVVDVLEKRRTTFLLIRELFVTLMSILGD